MQTIEIGDIPTWLATAISIIALFFAVRAAVKSQKFQQNQHYLERRIWIDQYFSSVRVWADQVCCAISEAIHIAEHPLLESERKLDVLIRLSAFIDTGRWYFPNVMPDQYGINKDPAYRGIRQDVLDAIIDAYDCLKSDNANKIEE
ncbi:MAG: hypothetical protein AB7G39_17400 [Alphaproteobacteria bacterium]